MSGERDLSKENYLCSPSQIVLYKRCMVLFFNVVRLVSLTEFREAKLSASYPGIESTPQVVTD